jgi:hypothetical protein
MRYHIFFPLAALLGVVIAQQWLGGLFDSYRVAAGFYDAFHGVWYALLTWLVLVVLQQRFAAFNVWLWLAAIWLGMFGLAVLGEMGKALVDQPLGVRDVLLNMMGVTAVLAIWGAERGLFSLRTCVVLAVGLLAASTFPLWQAQALQNYRNSLLPDLVRFDDPRAHELISSNSHVGLVSAPEGWDAFAGRNVLQVRFADTEFPGVTFPEPLPDWDAYSMLVIDLYHPEEARRPLYLRLLVRLREGEEAYLVDEVYQLTQGAHRIELPLNDYRDDRSPRVAGIRLHTNEDYRHWRLFIGTLRLE